MKRAATTILVLACAGMAFEGNPAKAQSTGASITLQPVPPKTVPPSDYPPGTTIVGQEIILGAVPARVWFELHATGWAPEVLKTIQGTIDAFDYDDDGGGFFAATADCLGSPPQGAGNLWPAHQPCNVNADCRAPMSGISAACDLGEPSKCVSRPGFLPGVGNICEWVFQNRCDPGWIGTGTMNVSAVDWHLDSRFGVAFTPPGQIPPDFQPSYFGTLVLDVPVNAMGTYTIDFDESQTLMQNPLGLDIPVSTFPARVTIPCGRCCAGYQSGAIECVDHVTQNQCENTSDQVFVAGELCPDCKGPDCPECAADNNCDDGIFCNGQETCDPGGECRPGQSPCEANEKCKEKTDTCKRRGRK